MEGLSFWVTALTASVFIGMGKGGVPLAPALAIPILSLSISPITAVGLLLPVLIISDLLGLYLYRHDYDKRILVVILLGMGLGVLVGWAMTSIISEAAVTILVGVIGLSFILKSLLKHTQSFPPISPPKASGIFWGALSGFTSFISHSGGIPYKAYTIPLGLKKPFMLAQ